MVDFVQQLKDTFYCSLCANFGTDQSYYTDDTDHGYCGFFLLRIKN